VRVLRSFVIALLVALVAPVAVAFSAPAVAQVVPLPPLPPPPEGGNPLSDLLGPAASDGCDGVAVAFALAAPIAQAQLPPELAALVDQVSPYLALATYACGFLAVPPSKQVCAVDAQVADAIGGLGLGELGVPVNTPKAAQIAYETAAGIERVFLRAGIDLEAGVAMRLAEALGCTVPPPPAVPPAAAAPSFPSSGGTEATAGSTSFVTLDIPGSLPTITRVSGNRTIPALVRTGPTRYPVDALATALLALPLVLLAGGAIVAPRLRKRSAP
jgi:hypothetical protein